MQTPSFPRLRAFSLAIVFSSPAWSAPATYTMQENVTPGARITDSYSHNSQGPGITPFYGYYANDFPSMNDNGVIVGRTDDANSEHPLILNAGEAAKWINSQKINLGVAGCKDADEDGYPDNSFCGSRALTINNNNVVAGSSNDWLAAQDTYFEKAYQFNQDGTYYRVFFYSPSQSQVEDNNDKGTSVGTGITAGGGVPYDGYEHGLYRLSDGKQGYIGIQYQHSRSHAVNSFDMITGSMVFDANFEFTYNKNDAKPWQVYRWHKNRVIWGGFLPGGSYSEGFDINDNGLVVGSAATADGKEHAFLWNSRVGLSQNRYSEFTNLDAELHSLLVDLGTLSGNALDQSAARSVNNAGQIVGWSDSPDGRHAFLYQDGVMHDLNSLAPELNGWELVDAYKINERGQILARGQRGYERSYLLLSPSPLQTPVVIDEWNDEPLDPASNIVAGVPDLYGPVVEDKPLQADWFVCQTDCASHAEIQGRYFATITTALEASAVGQTIMVLPGVYQENITLDSRNLVSWKGPVETIIDGSLGDTSTVYIVGDNDSSLDGFTVTGGKGLLFSSHRRGGGIFVSGSYNVTSHTLRNLIIKNNTAIGPDAYSGHGGGFYTQFGRNVTILDSLIENNQSGKHGGGIYHENCGRCYYGAQNTPLTIRRSRVVGNTSHMGAAAYSLYTTYFDKTVIAKNRATYHSTLCRANELTNSIVVGNFSSVTYTFNSLTGSAYKCYKLIAKNSTIAHNRGGVSDGTFQNSIIWESPSSLLSSAVVENSVVSDGYGAVGSIINADPLFVDPEAGDFRLQASSPAIDQGGDLSAAGIIDDAIGTPRPQDGDGLGAGTTGDGSDYDIGAFEYIQ